MTWQIVTYLTDIHICNFIGPIVLLHVQQKPMFGMPARNNCAKKVSNSWYKCGVITYIMHNTLYYVCNTPVLCHIHNKILCDIRQQQQPCFLCMQGATIFFMRHFLMRGLGNIWDSSNFGMGRGENVGFIDVISPVANV